MLFRVTATDTRTRQTTVRDEEARTITAASNRTWAAIPRDERIWFTVSIEPAPVIPPETP